MTTSEESLRVVGYADRLSVEAGHQIVFMVSCLDEAYDAAIVRLVHGDESARGPGFKETVVKELPRTAGRTQLIAPGSAMIARRSPVLSSAAPWTLLAWVYSTRRGRSQGLLGRWAPGVGGVRLMLDDEGVVALAIEDHEGEARVRCGPPIRPREWYLVAATWQPDQRVAGVVQIPFLTWPGDPTAARTTLLMSVVPPELPAAIPFVVGAGGIGADRRVQLAYDGKLEQPAVLGVALSPGRLDQIAQGDAIKADDRPTGQWDFGRYRGGVVPDISGQLRHGRVFNGPERCVTSHLWDGSASDPQAAPLHYAAIHFHSDDLDDARWAPDIRFGVPDGLQSGVYAARLRSGTHEDHIPFVVRPALGYARSRIVLLLPTLTYIAYANDHSDESSPENRHWKLPTAAPFADMTTWAAPHEYIRRNQLLSMYDTHADGDGVTSSSRLRPMLTFRPRYRYRQLAAPARFSADLYIVDWLEAMGYAFDVVTDEDLHADGHELLRPYDAVITGTHPEYATSEMLDSLMEYRDQGGRIAYLGGNGFYWVTSIDPERPHVIEVRRFGGTGPFETPPGEHHHSTTGELGGLWRNRGRNPQRLVGVGFSSSGSDVGAPYVRHPASFGDGVAWIFDGVEEETFGDIPSLVLGHGAAGYEMDRADPGLGTPPDAVILASSVGHPATYRPAIEDLESAIDWPLCDESQPPRGPHRTVRADLVYIDRGQAGTVFSTGSIGWAACLSANSYDNPVSRITDNVLRRWLAVARPGVS